MHYGRSVKAVEGKRAFTAAFPSTSMKFTAEPLAEDALLLRFGDTLDAATTAQVQAASSALHSAELDGVTDIAPAYATLLIRFNPFVPRLQFASTSLPHERLLEAVHSVLDSLPLPAEVVRVHRNEERGHAATRKAARIVELPVCYGSAFGQDLAEIAARSHMTPNEVIVRHTAPEYTVAMLGFAPGFPYLLGLDSALQAPRRATPRTRVPAGSVAIGGVQTGIYPRALPGGWNLIGRTPMTLFDPRRDPPCLLIPGNRVRFRAINADEFAVRSRQPS